KKLWARKNREDQPALPRAAARQEIVFCEGSEVAAIMFQHVTVLVSFIFAIALTHVFSSASQLLLARDRVRFSALLAVSMANAALGVISNWLSLWGLQNIKHWSLGEVLLQLGWVIPNYFSCSLVAMPVSESGLLDMSAFFERHRRIIFSATIAL